MASFSLKLVAGKFVRYAPNRLNTNTTAGIKGMRQPFDSIDGLTLLVQTSMPQAKIFVKVKIMMLWCIKP